MKPPAEAVSFEFRVPFHDVDAMRIVWHGHYLKYMDVARTELLRARGLDIPEISRLQLRLLVAESKCHHSAPLRYADQVRVTAWVTESWNRIRIAYEIWNLTTNRRAARASTLLVTTDADGKLLWKTPDALRDRLLP